MSDTADIGMNLVGINYWSTEYPFIDRMKTSSGWAAAGGVDAPIPVSADGYPTALPAGVPYAVTAIEVDPLSAGTDNTYVMTYSGTATFTMFDAQIISSEPGKITFQYSRPGSEGQGNILQIYVSGLDSSSPLTDMHIVRSDQQALFASGEMFNPAFVAKVSGFDTLRYMDWSYANGDNVTSWANRTTLSDATWAGTATSGVPIEVMVALANESKTNMWLNVPTKADDDYVRQMMTYVRDHLDPSLSVTLEYSNEVWNFGFTQSAYAMQQAAAMYDHDANGDGVIDQNDPREHYAAGWVQWYGYRSAQIANIANQVFAGDLGQLHNVISTQTVYTGLENYVFAGVAQANLGSVSSLFDDYAITTYFGNLQGSSDADKATILAWANEGAAGLDAAFAALKDGTGIQQTGSLASLLPIYAYQAAVAAKEGLNLVAYEGGVDLSALNFTGSDQQTVMDFFSRLDADPRMGQLYTQMINDFSAAGGTLLNAFDDAGVDSVGGTWGALKSIYDQTTPTWTALLAAENAAAGQSASTVTTPVSTSTTTTTVTTPVTSTTATTTTTPVTVTTPVASTTTTTTPVAVVSSTTTTTPVTGSATVTTTASSTASTGSTMSVATTSVLAPGTTDQANYTLAPTQTSITYVGTGFFNAVGNDLGDTITAGDGGSTLIGGAGADQLTGGAGADHLDGGAGVDRMVGGAGDDTYVVSDQRDQVVELPNGGTDTVLTSLNAYVVPDNVENLTYTGTGTFQAIGNGVGDVITGGAGVNRLLGGIGNDTLIGGAGNDVLDGGTGADTMIGGAGDDIYFVDNPGDVVVENAGGGTDIVYSSISYTLPDNVENLTFFGGGAINGTGNALNNVITGNFFANVLSGGAGDDTLIGGGGADVLTGGTGADRFVFRPGDLAADPSQTATITDFSRSDGDKIDLSAFDANPATPARDAFSFIGTAAFGDHPGELRIDTSGASQIVYGDLNGDGIADFSLMVSKGSGALIASDFVL